MKVGSKTHICDGGRKPGDEPFGRLVNLYVRRKRTWVKVGTMCSNCGDHWIKDAACEVSRPKSTKTGNS